MSLPTNLAFVTVMDVRLVHRDITLGKSYTLVDAGTIQLPIGNVDAADADLIAVLGTSTVDGVVAVPTITKPVADAIITLTETAKTAVLTYVGVNADDASMFDWTVAFTTATASVLILEPIVFTAGVIQDTYITDLASLDSLTISNVTQEGPRKEARGGKNAVPIIRYGKTARLEMEDVVFNIAALALIADVTVDDIAAPEEIDIVETFAKSIGLIGDTYIVEKETGDRKNAYLVFYSFLPDGVFDITMESEGDIGVMSIAGELFATNDKFFSIVENA